MIKEIDALDQTTIHIYQKNEQKTIFEPTQLVTIKRWDICGLLEVQEEQVEEYTKNKYFNYDKKGHLYNIEQDDCGEKFIVYDEYNRVLYHIDSMNRVIKNDYDLNNNLLHQTRYAKSLTHLDEGALRAVNWQPTPTGDSCIESTFYNAIGQLLCSIAADNALIEQLWQTQSVRHVYNLAGKVIRTYDELGHVRFFYYNTATIDVDNELVNHMDYDASNRCILKIQDVGGINATERWDYVDEEQLVLYSDANQNHTKTYYDNLNRKIKEITPLNHEIIYSWDELSRPKTTIDARLNSTSYIYEDHGRTIIKRDALSFSLIKRNAFDELEVEQNANGILWQKIYDVDGQVKTKIDAQGYASHYTI